MPGPAVDRGGEKGEAVPVRINSNVPGARGAASSTEQRMRVPLGYLVATRSVDRRLLGQAEGRAFAHFEHRLGQDMGETVPDPVEPIVAFGFI